MANCKDLTGPFSTLHATAASSFVLFPKTRKVSVGNSLHHIEKSLTHQLNENFSIIVCLVAILNRILIEYSVKLIVNSFVTKYQRLLGYRAIAPGPLIGKPKFLSVLRTVGK